MRILYYALTSLANNQKIPMTSTRWFLIVETISIMHNFTLYVIQLLQVSTKSCDPETVNSQVAKKCRYSQSAWNHFWITFLFRPIFFTKTRMYIMYNTVLYRNTSFYVDGKKNPLPNFSGELYVPLFTPHEICFHG